MAEQDWPPQKNCNASLEYVTSTPHAKTQAAASHKPAMVRCSGRVEKRQTLRQILA